MFDYNNKFPQCRVRLKISAVLSETICMSGYINQFPTMLSAPKESMEVFGDALRVRTQQPTPLGVMSEMLFTSNYINQIPFYQRVTHIST